MTDRTYRDQVDPITGDKRDRVIPVTNLRRIVIALDNALVEQRQQCYGDFLYADSNSTGTITVKLNSTSEDPIPLLAQASVEDHPMKDIFISCAPQAGRVLNLWYGYRARFRPPAQNIATIGSILNTVSVQDLGVTYGVAYASNTVFVANTPQNVLAAASNLNGARVVDAEFHSYDAGAANGATALLAKATAPATPIDGDVVCQTSAYATIAAAISDLGKLGHKVIVPAGRRLDWIASRATAGGQRKTLYTLL